MKYYLVHPHASHNIGFLFNSMKDTFAEHGHVEANAPGKADVILIDLQLSFESYDAYAMQMALSSRVPVVAFNFADYYETPGRGITHWHEVYNIDGYSGITRHKYVAKQEWAPYIMQAYELGLIKLQFLRQMMNTAEYPSFVEPIEFVDPNPMDRRDVTKDAITSLSSDMCFIGMPSVSRCNMLCSVLQTGLVKMDWMFPYAEIRLENKDWRDRIAYSKFFIEADGAGYGSNRPQQLCGIRPMLKQKNSRLCVYPWTSGVNCIEVGDGHGNVSLEEVVQLREVLDNPERVVEIYEAGYEHIQKFSAKNRAEYVLEKMATHGVGV